MSDSKKINIKITADVSKLRRGVAKCDTLGGRHIPKMGRWSKLKRESRFKTKKPIWEILHNGLYSI